MISDTKSSNVPLRLGLGIILCLVLMGTGVGTGTTTAQATTIDVTIGNDTLENRGEHIVVEDPTANISVTSNEPIELIEIRVDGKIRRSYRPDERSFERDIQLDLDPNENTVEVISRADSVVTFETTLTKHTASPRVQYTSPFSTSILGGPDNKTNVSSGQVTLAGTLHTVSEVEQIQIERTHIQDDDQTSQNDRKLHRITDPGDSFSQNLLLGNGINEIVVRYIDSEGRTNKDSFELIVNDATDPVITFNAPNKSYTDTAPVWGTIRDETKLDRVKINRTSNNGSQMLLIGTDADPDLERLTHQFDTTIDLYDDNDDNEFRLVAEDTAGNVQEQTFSVEYDPTPRITITQNATNATAETVHVTGNVSEAQISRVTIETIDMQTSERLDVTRAYEGGPTMNAVEFNQTLRAIPDDTVVNILVAYENGQHTKSVVPVIVTPQNDTGEESDETDGVVNATEPGADSDDDNDEPVDDSGESSPTLIPIRTRATFGGVVIVGTIYLLGHWA